MNCSVVSVLLFVVAFAATPVWNAKILGVCPVFGKSHWAVGSSVLKALADQGHEITVLSPYPMPKSNVSRYREIDLAGLLEEFQSKKPTNLMESAVFKIPPVAMFMAVHMGKIFVDYVMNHPEVKDLMNSNEKFDLVIVESLGTDALLGFGEHFNAPMIGIGTTTSIPIIDNLIGNPSPMSYVPNIFLPYTSKMTFFQRLINGIVLFCEKIVLEGYGYTIQGRLHRKYFPNANRSFEQVRSEDVSLVFVNTHFSLSFPRPYVPNMIEIGGINIDRTVNMLPKEYQDFMDNADDGVILFSMGSILRASDFKQEQRDEIIKAFAKLKQRVIWRYNMPDASELPKNIMAREWLPQKEIQSHPNLRAFITHGGMLGTTEATYHGVPMIGIPVFGDQHLNIARAVDRGYAVKLDLHNITEGSLSEAISEMLNNPKYSENAKTLSKIYRDQPMTPQESVVYWSEYVMRHNGAKHMRVEGRKLHFIAYHGLDVIAIIFILAMILIVFPNYFILGCIKRRFFSKPGTKKQKQF